MNRKIAYLILLIIILINTIMGIIYWKGDNFLRKQNRDFKFPIESINSKTITPRLIKDRPSIMLFFNTQCDLCLAELSLLKNNINQLSKSYNIFFISFEPKNSLISFFSEHGIDRNINNLYIISDKKMSLLDYYNIEGYPAFIIFNKKKQIINKGASIDNSLLSKLLKENYLNGH